jgi:hypothetical protein
VSGSGPIKPYEISTTGDFRRRMLENMPEGTRHESATLGTLSPDPAGWFALDPRYYRPEQPREETFLLDRPVTLVVDLLVPPEGRPVIAALEVRLTEAAPTQQRQLESSAAVDSNTLMIAATSRIAAEWKIGGPGCGVNLLHDKDFALKTPEGKREMAAAAEALRKAGLPLELQGSWWELTGVVTDALIARTQQAMREHPNVGVNINQSSTGARLKAAMQGQTSAVLDDFAIVLRTGFGNGIFYWDELLAGDAPVGWRMSFIDEE